MPDKNTVSTIAELEKRLHILEKAQARQAAIQAITDVLHSYSRGWDRYDRETIESCFFPDATMEFGYFEGTASEFIDGGLKGVAEVKSITHVISNIRIDIQGDHAVSECYFTAHHRRACATGQGDEDWFLIGRYLDQLQCRAGEWRISHRIGLQDCSRTFAPADISLDEMPESYHSARKPNDPLYGLLAKLENR